MRGSIENVSRNILTTSFLKERTLDKYVYLTKEDFNKHKIRKDLSIELIVTLNKEAKIMGMTIPIIAISSGIVKTRISSMDLYSLEKYKISKVIEAGEIEVRAVSEMVKCPACKNSVTTIEPSYIMPSCQFGCDLGPDKWIRTSKDELVDVASGRLLLESEENGMQEVEFLIDRDMIGANGNYKKLSSWIPPSTLLIDAFAIPVYQKSKKFSFALWITNVEVVKEKQKEIENGKDNISFEAPEEVKSEKDVVHSVFFKNFDYMKEVLKFDKYYLQKAFPDLIIRERNGGARIIEFEFESKNFDIHQHDASICDYIICWVDNRKKKDHIKVIELKKFIGTKISC